MADHSDSTISEIAAGAALPAAVYIAFTAIDWPPGLWGSVLLPVAFCVMASSLAGTLIQAGVTAIRGAWRHAQGPRQPPQAPCQTRRAPRDR